MKECFTDNEFISMDKFLFKQNDIMGTEKRIENDSISINI